MTLIPLTRMWERVERGREDSDSALFHDLMYLGEMIVKLSVVGMVASIADEKERLNYKQRYSLVRSDGIGDWSSVLDEVLTGPPAQYLVSEARTEQRVLTQKQGTGTWQYDSCLNLNKCLNLLEHSPEDMLTKVDGKRWLTNFARLRNKTRGHGAIRTSLLSEICPLLESSIRMFVDNFPLFQRQWAYVYRNLSGKYRITRLSSSASSFEQLKKSSGSANENLKNGVYVMYDKYTFVDLIYSDVDASDFYFPNGAFNGKRYEIISYISGNIQTREATEYLAPVGELPASETQPSPFLDIQGTCFSNMPAMPAGYIQRFELEQELYTVLNDDNHPIITLLGRGGIGKTSLALATIHKISRQSRYQVIIWFSARDIDLMPSGPKQVKPHVVRIDDIAKEYSRLVDSSKLKEKNFNHIEWFSANLTNSSFGPTLFVFDNFETMADPVDLYKNIDTFIRNPNKAIITTRYRGFKGDYPIEVQGMSEEECEKLISNTASKLNIQGILTAEYRRSIIDESDGHPYVIKILLGEVAKNKKAKNIERIVADKDDILTALFERTYANLSPVARRVFLTLCNWRSSVPQIAIEAVMLRAHNERMDICGAISDLEHSSFVEVIESDADRQLFLSVPLVTSLFGRTKLSASPMKSAVEADTEILHQFGTVLPTDIRHGVAPRIERLVKYIAKTAQRDPASISQHMPMLEFIARKYTPTWVQISRIYEEFGDYEKAKDALRKFLETSQSDHKSWHKLADLCRRAGDGSGEVHALVEMCKCKDISYEFISESAYRVNSICTQLVLSIGRDEVNILITEMARIMKTRLSEANSTDLSRLAWLYLHIKDEEEAREIVDRGLMMDPENEYCLRLREKLDR